MYRMAGKPFRYIYIYYSQDLLALKGAVCSTGVCWFVAAQVFFNTVGQLGDGRIVASLAG
jgi:uncharacterized membrane protein (GlpM family)